MDTYIPVSQPQPHNALWLREGEKKVNAVAGIGQPCDKPLTIVPVHRVSNSHCYEYCMTVRVACEGCCEEPWAVAVHVCGKAIAYPGWSVAMVGPWRVPVCHGAWVISTSCSLGSMGHCATASDASIGKKLGILMCRSHCPPLDGCCMRVLLKSVITCNHVL